MLTAKRALIFEPQFAKLIGLEEREYAALLCIDEAGRRVTVLGSKDMSVTDMIEAAIRDSQDEQVVVGSDLFDERRDGWPEDWVDMTQLDES